MKKSLVLLAGLVAGTTLAADFSAGFSRVDITPPLGIFMPGYLVKRYAKQVLDPLQINCLALSDGKRTAIIQQLDTISMSDYVAGKMRDAIAAKCGVERGAILLHCSHTHVGGYLRTPGPEGEARFGEIERIYMDMAITRAVDASVAAIADLKPAKFSSGRSEAKRISFGRLYRMKDGSAQTNPGTNNPDIVAPIGEADDSVQVLRIDREGGKAIALVNFQTHPDTIGGETLSADWPGLTRTVFEAATFGDTHCLVINGFQGDLNHCNVRPRPGEMNGLKRDFDAVDRGYDHAKHMANAIAGAALSVWLKCAPLETGAIGFDEVTVRVPANKAKDTDEKNLAWANEVWALHEAGKDAEVSKKYGCYEMQLTTELARASRIRKMANHADFHEVPLFTVTVGKSVAFCAFPGEPFNEIGRIVKAKSPFALTIPACLTNGRRGYFPSAASFKAGGYESATSPFGPTVADDLIGAELKVLNRLVNR